MTINTYTFPMRFPDTGVTANFSFTMNDSVGYSDNRVTMLSPADTNAVYNASAITGTLSSLSHPTAALTVELLVVYTDFARGDFYIRFKAPQWFLDVVNGELSSTSSYYYANGNRVDYTGYKNRYTDATTTVFTLIFASFSVTSPLGYEVTVNNSGTAACPYNTNSAGNPIPTSLTLVPASNICFVADTPVLTDQGEIPICNLDPRRHTIGGKTIVAITKTTSLDPYIMEIDGKTRVSKNHRILYRGRMTRAQAIPDAVRIPYSGELLYNVLLEQAGYMIVNKRIVETLHPDNTVAKFYRGVSQNSLGVSQNSLGFAEQVALLRADTLKSDSHLRRPLLLKQEDATEPTAH